MREELENQLNISSSGDMVEQVTYMIYGAIMTTTKGFRGCEIKIDPKSNRVFCKIKLNWWAKVKTMSIFRRYWMAKAERRAEEFVPNGFKILIYYEGGAV